MVQFVVGQRDGGGEYFVANVALVFTFSAADLMGLHVVLQITP